MRRFLVIALLVSLSPTAFALDGKDVAYVGGTIPGLKEGSEGKLDTTNEQALLLKIKKHTPIEIPYASISELEYGQKAGRRVGMAIMVSPIALFSKKRKHFLTISYKDAAGKDQAAVLELGKDIVRTTLTIVETRSGKALQYQDEEARKQMGGGK